MTNQLLTRGFGVQFRTGLALVFICLILSNTQAQDGHYWTQQYGTRSMLLSGSVIGGVEDLGALFYNPGRLGLIENPAFLLSADVYEWTRFTVTDAFGESADISNSNFGGVPSLVAGTFNVGFLKNHRFGYSILQRQSMDINFSYKNEIQGDVLENFPGEEYFGGAIRIFQKVKEQWASLTWSYPFNEKLSLGIATNLMVFDQDKGNIIELQALASTKQTAIYRLNRGFSLQEYGLLWKAGLAADLKRVLLGLTVTTPTVSLRGQGNYQYEEFFSGIPGFTERDDIYTTSRQNDLPVTLRKPWAVGMGITFPIRKNNLHLSGEWYSQIPQYTLIQPSGHISQSNGDTIGFTLVDELNSVLNLGMGLELYLKEKISLYASFSTDYSAVVENPVAFSENQPIATNSLLSADYYHFGGGFALSLKGADLTLGTTYTGGDQDFARPVDFPDKEDDNIFERDEIATLGWSRWRLVFSFSVKFLKNYAEKVMDKTE